MELYNYVINVDTLVLIPFGRSRTVVYEGNKKFIVKKSSYKIIEDSCLFYGSSFEGRKNGTKFLIGVDMKVPIVVEDTRNIIFFPVSSCIRKSSIWVSYQNLIRYLRYNDLMTIVYFKDNIAIKLGCKYCLFDNQFVRCIKLEKMILNRKKFLRNNALIYDDF